MTTKPCTKSLSTTCCFAIVSGDDRWEQCTDCGRLRVVAQHRYLALKEADAAAAAFRRNK